MYIEASSPRKSGDVATLVSPLLTPQQHCLKMWYHMYGKQVGTLKVYELSDKRRQLVAKESGEKGENWLLLSVDINRSRPKKSNVEMSDVIVGQLFDELFPDCLNRLQTLEQLRGVFLHR